MLRCAGGVWLRHDACICGRVRAVGRCLEHGIRGNEREARDGGTGWGFIYESILRRPAWRTGGDPQLFPLETASFAQQGCICKRRTEDGGWERRCGAHIARASWLAAVRLQPDGRAGSGMSADSTHSTVSATRRRPSPAILRNNPHTARMPRSSAPTPASVLATGQVGPHSTAPSLHAAQDAPLSGATSHWPRSHTHRTLTTHSPLRSRVHCPAIGLSPRTYLRPPMCATRLIGPAAASTAKLPHAAAWHGRTSSPPSPPPFAPESRPTQPSPDTVRNGIELRIRDIEDCV